MSTTASLVVGADGSTTKNGNSGAISTPADRVAFLARRGKVDVIIIGGNTARNEPYHHTPVPLVVISRSKNNPLTDNPKANLWNLSPSDAIIRARDEFGPKILIEGGTKMINELLEQGLISEFFLTVTPELNGENVIDWREILNSFTSIENSETNGTLFFHAHN